MNTYVSLIRGINVGGKKVIPMADLLKVYSGLEFTNSKTYLQSGNIVFQCNILDTKSLETLLTKQLIIRFGFEVPVLVLELSQMRDIVNANPYVLDQKRNTSALHVTFLFDKPKVISLEKLNTHQSHGEEFSITDRAVYLHCPRGYGKTKLNNSFIEKQLNVSATTRNWNTTIQLHKIMESISDGE